ncbi:glycoside hydrolase family 113 [Kordia sp.]|uniref:glycoside hydrolase family 113 n=1 Tax=Kordia sp. TaxID=1965332 RepID=UPI003D289E7C
MKIKIAALKLFLWFYGCTAFILLMLAFLLILHKNDYSVHTTTVFFLDVVGRMLTSIFFHIIAILPYLIFLLIKRIISDYKRNKIKGLLTGSLLKAAIFIAILYIGNLMLQSYRVSEVSDYTWDTTVENNSNSVNNYGNIDKKQRGIHVFNISGNSEDIEKLKTNNFEWITLTPFISQGDYNKPSLRVISEDRYKNILKHYKAIKAECDVYGIKIMLKPHIWLSKTKNGKWRSDINMETEQDWNTWFKNYNQIILKYATLAEELQLEQFCIGTELETTIYEKPEQWKALIQKVKAVYKGKLTYAANWNAEYKKVPFWDELDYIGIQAYFPLSEKDDPTLEALENYWKKHTEEIALVSSKFNKPILFTELGYKSIQGTSKKPWEWNGIHSLYSKISKGEQLLCYQAFFNTIWKEPWFHGIHIWEWQGRGESDGNNTNFTIEGKPSLNLIAKHFKGN